MHRGTTPVLCLSAEQAADTASTTLVTVCAAAAATAGCHCRLTVVEDTKFHPSDTWNLTPGRSPTGSTALCLAADASCIIHLPAKAPCAHTHLTSMALRMCVSCWSVMSSSYCGTVVAQLNCLTASLFSRLSKLVFRHHPRPHTTPFDTLKHTEYVLPRACTPCHLCSCCLAR